MVGDLRIFKLVYKIFNWPAGHTRQAKLQDSKASSIFSGKFKRVLLS